MIIDRKRKGALVGVGASTTRYPRYAKITQPERNLKMSNILEELWYGNIVPCDDALQNNERSKELLRLAVRHQNDLSATLGEKQYEVFEKYNDCLNEMSDVGKKEVFAYGFRLGARIADEVLGREV